MTISHFTCFLCFLPLSKIPHWAPPTELRVFLPLSALFMPAVGALRSEQGSSSHSHCRSCRMCKASWVLLLPPWPALHCHLCKWSICSSQKVEAVRTWELFEREKLVCLLPHDIVNTKCANTIFGCILLGWILKRTDKKQISGTNVSIH